MPGLCRNRCGTSAAHGGWPQARHRCKKTVQIAHRQRLGGCKATVYVCGQQFSHGFHSAGSVTTTPLTGMKTMTGWRSREPGGSCYRLARCSLWMCSHQGIQSCQKQPPFHRFVLHRPAGTMVTAAQQQHLTGQFGVANQMQRLRVVGVHDQNFSIHHLVLHPITGRSTGRESQESIETHRFIVGKPYQSQRVHTAHVITLK